MSLPSDQGVDAESSSGSSEAKTDRYGFLLVNGDTNNDSDDPCPELVRHREMKWISLIGQWDQVLEKKHNKIKAQCQKGIPASVRSKCWPLLCGAKQRKENNENLYKMLESSPGQQSWIDVIKRDTDRQFPFHEMFQSEDSFGQQGLLQVLKAYTQFRPDEGYCQAQGPVAAVLLMNMPMEEAFWCLVQISELYLPGYYSPLLEGVLFDAAVLFSVLKRTCPAAYKHMQRQGVEPLMFATDWLMCLYSRHLPFNTLLRVWDLFFCNGVRVLFQVAVVLVRRCLGEARQRKDCEGQMETLESLRSVRGRVQHEQADTFIQEVSSVPLSLAELQRLTEKEFEKWRKERPGSNFDPRGRCHGYHMIWDKGKEREKENNKGRLGANLRASVTRSHSSLSPAILRKKWRKRGSKVETEAWEGRGFSKPDSDEEEKRRASVCGVAGELRARTDATPQEFAMRLQGERSAAANTQSVATEVARPSSDSPDCGGDGVFEEEEEEGSDAETRKETEGSETRQDEGAEQVQTPEENQDEEISTQEPETQRVEDAINKPEDPTHENRIHQEEESDPRTPEEALQLEQEAGVDVNKDTREEETRIGTDSFKQEEEEVDDEDVFHPGNVEAPAKGNEMDQEVQEPMGIKAYDIEQEAGIRHENEEVGILDENEIKGNDIEQEAGIRHENADKENEEVGILDENEIKANNKQEAGIRHENEEVGILDGNEIKANNKQEAGIRHENEVVGILNDNEIKGNDIEQEAEIPEDTDVAENGGEFSQGDDEEEIRKARLPHEADDEQQEEQNDFGKSSEREEEIPEDREQAAPLEKDDHAKGELDHSMQEEEEERISDGRGGEESDGTVVEEGKGCTDNPAVNRQETGQAASLPCVHPEIPMEDSGVSGTPREPDSTHMKAHEASTTEHGELDPDPPQLDVEKGVNATAGSNPHPQIRLRRSSSSHTSYPTILSEDTFKDPNQRAKRESCPRADDPDETRRPKHEEKSDKPKRRGLFHRLRAETPSKSTIPKIVVQDFSQGEDKLSSKERRRRRRMQERKEKEEEKERKKQEKEKGRERKKPQTRGKSFQVLSRRQEDDDDDEVFSGRAGTRGVGQKRKSYSESYF